MSFVLLEGGCRNPAEPARKTQLEGIRDLKAYSRDSASVGIAWSQSQSVNTSYMANHEVTIRSGSTVVQSFPVASSETGVIVPNLAEGTIYGFDVAVKANSESPYRDSFPVSINWSPAKRFATEAGTGQPLRLYETDSPGTNHALQCYLDSLRGPRLLSVATTARVAMDLYLLSTLPTLKLRSGDVYSPSPAGKQTKFSDFLPLDVSSLDSPQSAVPGAETYVLDEVYIPSGTIPTGQIFFLRTEDQHYVRLLVLRGANNSLIQGTAPNRYIELHLSYQSVPAVRFASMVPDTPAHQAFFPLPPCSP